MAPTSDAQWTALSKIVTAVMARADAAPFREPVDWKGLGIMDYPQIIKKPMDLGTVKKRISGRKYNTVFDAANDVRLVWTNCMTYNQDGSDFFVIAKRLSKLWEDKFAKFVRDQKLSEDSGTTKATPSSGTTTTTSSKANNVSAPPAIGNGDQVSLQEKREFARSLYKLSKEDLGKIIVKIDDRCPAALVKNAAEDECEMNVDKLTPELFKELVTLVAVCGRTSTGKKKASNSKRQKT
uniref:Bromo domain-containing protein n=1 Tax=Craspedostauros australis TaxID=1486917 RepID=A0A7S0F5U8_9STRA|mmetsp:Transcript_758/g.2150  ORF Transcript_758/g.2150 Transcript_758/m.2150 type:complete len:238 (+) Transcript_758:143-856(+)|eukprot:CAMPEP_0198111914 /NCGR_PEP_ID=MMETSP1442-20131203/3831_1 /TAXON_ID= /ORGANISM="Craspedostauros australis, Strain CCMP3328" /LENGTH=237 /DNA_ID=CAMNT_0043768521 /DNA_START=125 /DNA_END=838 /DNA_ORIENTATION=+